MENIKELLGPKFKHLVETAKKRILIRLKPLIEDLKADIKKDLEENPRKASEQYLREAMEDFMLLPGVQKIMHSVIHEIIKENESTINSSLYH